MKTGFPKELFKPEMSVLSLFSAAFTGRNDVNYIKEAGCTNVTLVDYDIKKLSETSEKYKYNAVCIDIFKALENNESLGGHDIVISDQWTQHDELIHVKHLDKLLKTAKKYLILSCNEYWLKGRRPEPGEYYKRSDYQGGTYWRVICK
jgi:hypothetical protein